MVPTWLVISVEVAGLVELLISYRLYEEPLLTMKQFLLAATMAQLLLDMLMVCEAR
jgi:hypothetical protein